MVSVDPTSSQVGLLLVLAPYWSSRNIIVRYHMSQFNSGLPPRNKEELFDWCHDSLCSWEDFWGVEEEMDDSLWFSKIRHWYTKRVIMATMRLHNCMNISNFADAGFAEIMSFAGIMKKTWIINTDLENDSDDTETSYATNAVDVEYMSRIRYNIANILWKNFNSWYYLCLCYVIRRILFYYIKIYLNWFVFRTTYNIFTVVLLFRFCYRSYFTMYQVLLFVTANILQLIKLHFNQTQYIICSSRTAQSTIIIQSHKYWMFKANHMFYWAVLERCF